MVILCKKKLQFNTVLILTLKFTPLLKLTLSQFASIGLFSNSFRINIRLNGCKAQKIPSWTSDLEEGWNIDRHFCFLLRQKLKIEVLRMIAFVDTGSLMKQLFQQNNYHQRYSHREFYGCDEDHLCTVFHAKSKLNFFSDQNALWTSICSVTVWKPKYLGSWMNSHLFEVLFSITHLVDTVQLIAYISNSSNLQGLHMNSLQIFVLQTCICLVYNNFPVIRTKFKIRWILKCVHEIKFVKLFFYEKKTYI